MYPVLLIGKKAGKMSANLQPFISADVTSKICYLKGVGMLTSISNILTYNPVPHCCLSKRPSYSSENEQREPKL